MLDGGDQVVDRFDVCRASRGFSGHVDHGHSSSAIEVKPLIASEVIGPRCYSLSAQADRQPYAHSCSTERLNPGSTLLPPGARVVSAVRHGNSTVTLAEGDRRTVLASRRHRDASISVVATSEESARAVLDPGGAGCGGPDAAGPRHHGFLARSPVRRHDLPHPVRPGRCLARPWCTPPGYRELPAASLPMGTVAPQ
ncbi:DUF5925 domain-containing protein [Streptomyces syringium]|uniref:DUF5925 domain-containing protein n=1 Tax=Streptomyces syringium TaxID=76729 RepID=UPI003F50EDD3